MLPLRKCTERLYHCDRSLNILSLIMIILLYIYYNFYYTVLLIGTALAVPCHTLWRSRTEKARPHERAKLAEQRALLASWRPRAREIISKSCSRLSELCFPTGELCFTTVTGWSHAETPASCARFSANFIPSSGRCRELCSWTLIAARRALLARVDGHLVLNALLGRCLSIMFFYSLFGG